MKHILLVLLAGTLMGCPAVCEQFRERCSPEGNPQVCDTRGRWQDVGDCQRTSELSGGEWTCQESVDGFSCLPEVPE